MVGRILSKKQRRTKRGGRKVKKSEPLVIFSNNVAGLKKKIDSFKLEVKELKAAVFTLQETHFAKKGKLKMEEYEIFESIRKKEKGGTLIGAHKALNPMLIQEYSEEFELLVVEINVKNKEIRIISGYGPQESWNEVDRMPFFIALEKEIAKSELLGKSLIIETDSNSKPGPDYISKDPHKQSQNGKLLAGIIDRHGLIVANGMVEKCVGSITRKRVTKENTEESIIDHVLISEDLKEDLEHLLVDEEGNHALRKMKKTKKAKDNNAEELSDHNPLISQFLLKWDRRKTKRRIEMFNLKNLEGQSKFTELTNNGTFLSEVFDNDDDLNKCTNVFIKRLNQVIFAKASRKLESPTAQTKSWKNYM